MVTAVWAGIEILRVRFGGNPAFPFDSPQIFSPMLMKIIPVLVALRAVLLSQKSSHLNKRLTRYGHLTPRGSSILGEI